MDWHPLSDNFPVLIVFVVEELLHCPGKSWSVSTFLCILGQCFEVVDSALGNDVTFNFFCIIDS